MVLKVDNLNAYYGDHHVLKNISFEIEDILRPGEIAGQLVAILGESGCGKSTFFKTLSGLKEYEGTISILNNEMEIINPIAGDVGFVDQKYTMFRHKTVYQSLKFSLRDSNLNENEKKDKIESLLNEMGIFHIKDKYPNELSGGQKQRSALLERLLRGNTYIILDEPFSGLDVKNKEASKRFIRNVVNQHEINTFLFSTHQIDDAVELADVILIFSNNGELIYNLNLRKEGYEYGSYTSKHQTLTKEIKKIFT